MLQAVVEIDGRIITKTNGRCYRSFKTTIKETVLDIEFVLVCVANKARCMTTLAFYISRHPTVKDIVGTIVKTRGLSYQTANTVTAGGDCSCQPEVFNRVAFGFIEQAFIVIIRVDIQFDGVTIPIESATISITPPSDFMCDGNVSH